MLNNKYPICKKEPTLQERFFMQSYDNRICMHIEDLLPKYRESEEYSRFTDGEILDFILLKIKSSHTSIIASMHELRAYNPDDPRTGEWANYDPEEILAMHDNGILVPNDIYEWAQAMAKVDEVTYQNTSDDDFDINSETDITALSENGSDSEDVNNIKTLNNLTTSAEKQGKQLKENADTIQKNNEEVSKKTEQAKTEQENTKNDIEKMSGEMKDIENRVENGQELSDTELSRYKKLGEQIRTEDKSLKLFNKDLNDDVEKLLNSIDNFSGDIGLEESLSQNLDNYSNLARNTVAKSFEHASVESNKINLMVGMDLFKLNTELTVKNMSLMSDLDINSNIINSNANTAKVMGDYLKDIDNNNTQLIHEKPVEKISNDNKEINAINTDSEDNATETNNTNDTEVSVSGEQNTNNTQTQTEDLSEIPSENEIPQTSEQPITNNAEETVNIQENSTTDNSDTDDISLTANRNVGITANEFAQDNKTQNSLPVYTDFRALNDDSFFDLQDYLRFNNAFSSAKDIGNNVFATDKTANNATIQNDVPDTTKVEKSNISSENEATVTADTKAELEIPEIDEETPKTEIDEETEIENNKDTQNSANTVSSNNNSTEQAEQSSESDTQNEETIQTSPEETEIAATEVISEELPADEANEVKDISTSKDNASNTNIDAENEITKNSNKSVAITSDMSAKDKDIRDFNTDNDVSKSKFNMLNQSAEHVKFNKDTVESSRTDTKSRMEEISNRAKALSEKVDENKNTIKKYDDSNTQDSSQEVLASEETIITEQATENNSKNQTENNDKLSDRITELEYDANTSNGSFSDINESVKASRNNFATAADSTRKLVTELKNTQADSEASVKTTQNNVQTGKIKSDKAEDELDFVNQITKEDDGSDYVVEEPDYKAIPTVADESRDVQEYADRDMSVSDHDIDLESDNNPDNNTKELEIVAQKAVEENITDERENVYLNPLIHDTRIDTEDRMAETADLEITDIAEQGAMEESTRNSVKSEVAETMKSTLSDVSKRAQKKDTDNDKKHKLFTEFENKKRSQLRKTVQKVSKARDVR